MNNIFLRFFSFTFSLAIIISICLALKQLLEGDSLIQGFKWAFIPLFLFAIFFSIFGSLYSFQVMSTYDCIKNPDLLNESLVKLRSDNRFNISNEEGHYKVYSNTIYEWFYGTLSFVQRDNILIVHGAKCVVRKYFGRDNLLKEKKAD